MKNVLVTGAAGFLGSHLVRHHLDRGDWVLGVDDFSSSDPNSKHLRDLRANDRFKFAEVDICDDHHRWLPELHSHLDLVYNFACIASPPLYQAAPVHTMLTCVVGTANILDLAQLHKAVVVHASTSEVYGDPDCSPQPEAYRGCVNSYGPRSCYDEGKRAAEALCYDYRHSYGVDARLVRIFNTYGPHMDPYDGRVVSNFIRQALNHDRLTVYGDGGQGRSLCYVDDLIRGIVALGALERNPGTPINLGNPREMSVYVLAQMVLKRIYGGSVLPRFGANDPNMVTFMPLPKDDPTQRCPDITLARTLLGWEPTVKLEDGLDRTIAYFREVLGGN